MFSRVEYVRLFALLLSAAAHMVAVVMFQNGSGGGGVEARHAAGPRAMTVSFSPRNEAVDRHPPSEPQPLAAPLKAPSRRSMRQDAKGAMAGKLSSFPAIGEPEHYFRLSELTEKPLVIQDIPPSMVILVPDAVPQPVILRLLIGDEGDVERVFVEDANLPERAQRLLMEAFSKLRFYPGKIGHIQVKSQLRIEVMLEPVPSGQTTPAGHTDLRLASPA